MNCRATHDVLTRPVLVLLCLVASVSGQSRSCPPGAFSNVTLPNVSGVQSTCDTYTECLPGFRVVAWGDSNTDRQCAACFTGTYTSALNQLQCLPYNDCQPGTRHVSGPSASTGRVCEDCTTLVSFTSTMNQPACSAVRSCPPGSYVAGLPTRAADRQCSSCPTNSYTFAVNTHRCSTATACAVGVAYEDIAPTASTDRHCADASPSCGSTDIEVAPVTANADRQCAENMCLRPGIFARCPIDAPLCSYVSTYQQIWTLGACRQVQSSVRGCPVAKSHISPWPSAGCVAQRLTFV